MSGGVLFNPRVNGFLTKMDDSKSMVSLALRDGVETSGRTILEYQRDPHGGRERLIEEAATMTIWAFGINWMKQLYDKLAPRLNPKIRLPDLDAALLKKETVSEHPGLMGYFSQPSSQTLVDKAATEELNQFAHQFGGIYQDLKTVIGDKAIQQAYSHSNVLKFLFATGIPVSIIGFGIPTFNQWLTKRILTAEKAKQSNTASQPGHATKTVPQAHGSHPNFRFPVQQIQFNHGPVTNVFLPGTIPPGLQANPQALQAFSQQAFPQQPFNASAHPPAGGSVRFGGGLGDLASSFLQNERMNTLLVDGTISGGRIYKARNWQERAEIIFREGCIITFLYFAQKAIQDLITNRLIRNHSQLGFDSTKYLHDRYKGNSKQFHADFEAGLEELKKGKNGKLLDKLKEQEGQQGLQFWKNLLGNRKKLTQLQQSHYQLEKTLVKQIQQYFLNEADAHGKPNLIFETAKHCGWIPMKEYQGKRLLDLSKKIDVEPIWNLIIHLNQISKNAKLEQALKKAIRGRAGAWLLSNAICTFFLSYLCPKIQHKITYWRTGKDYFPGVQPS